MKEDPYLIPGTHVLRNLFGTEDGLKLDALECAAVLERSAQGAPRGGFDLAHLRAIHQHLFQDVYAWAGELRTVELAKGESQFAPLAQITSAFDQLHAGLVDNRFLKGLDRAAFVQSAAELVGTINAIHPFREGNGRAQLQYLSQLADQAGHPIDLARLDAMPWLEASVAAQFGELAPMRREIERIVIEAGPLLEVDLHRGIDL